MERHTSIILIFFILSSILLSSGCTSKRDLNTKIEVAYKDVIGTLRPAMGDEYSLDDTIYIRITITGLENDKKIAKAKILFVKIETQNNGTIYLKQNDTIEIPVAASFLSASYSDTFTVRAKELGEGEFTAYLKVQDMKDGEIQSSSYPFKVKNFFVENLLRNLFFTALAFVFSRYQYKKYNKETFNPKIWRFYKDSYFAILAVMSLLMFIFMGFQHSIGLRLFSISSITLFFVTSLVIPVAIHKQEIIKFNEEQEKIEEERRQRFQESQEKKRREHEEYRRQEEEKRWEEERKRQEHEEHKRREEERKRREREEERQRREQEERNAKSKTKPNSDFYRNPKDLSNEELLRIAKILKQHPTKKDIQKQRRKCAKKVHPDAVPPHLREKALEMMKFYNSVFDELLERFNYT